MTKVLNYGALWPQDFDRAVVKWSVCFPSTPTIRVPILLQSTVLFYKNSLKRAKINEKGAGDGAHFLKISLFLFRQNKASIWPLHFSCGKNLESEISIPGNCIANIWPTFLCKEFEFIQKNERTRIMFKSVIFALVAALTSLLWCNETNKDKFQRYLSYVHWLWALWLAVQFFQPIRMLKNYRS